MARTAPESLGRCQVLAGGYERAQRKAWPQLRGQRCLVWEMNVLPGTAQIIRYKNVTCDLGEVCSVLSQPVRPT